MSYPDAVPGEYRAICGGDPVRAATDYVAGMTDRYAVRTYEELFVPRPMR